MIAWLMGSADRKFVERKTLAAGFGVTERGMRGGVTIQDRSNGSCVTFNSSESFTAGLRQRKSTSASAFRTSPAEDLRPRPIGQKVSLSTRALALPLFPTAHLMSLCWSLAIDDAPRLSPTQRC